MCIARSSVYPHDSFCLEVRIFLIRISSPYTQGSRFPGQENGDFKIPSVIRYANDGQTIAVGGELDQKLNHDGVIFVGRYVVFETDS